MVKDDQSTPEKQSGTAHAGGPARAERDARLAEALRANLQRRKAQVRGRKAIGKEPSQSDSD